MLKLVTAMMLVGFVTPALAAAEYWVVQSDPSVRKCTVVQTQSQPGKAETPPQGALGAAYPTQEEADAVIKRQQRCGGGSD